jgi:hypothetical protein
MLEAELLEMGTTAIARTRPANSLADAATFIGELREGLPSLVGREFFKRDLLSATAKENLNWEFGLKPFVRDIKSFVEASKLAEEHLEQLRRDQRKVVRRRYDFPETNTFVTEDLGSGFATGSILGGGAFLQEQGARKLRKKFTRRIWFSGGYKYTLPPEGSVLRRIRELDAIYGVRPDAETVWNLAPWSWCLDWFSNSGDVVSNLTAFSTDGLLLKYGYIMCHTTHEYTYTWDGAVQNASSENAFVPHHAEQKITYETKQRLPATPYGFGLALSDLSPRRLGILTSLGIIRGSHLT